MAMGMVGKTDFVGFLKPIGMVDENPGLLKDERINLSRDGFDRIKKLIGNIVWLERPCFSDFWYAAHRDPELLPGLARLLWHTGSWAEMNKNIFSLLALQQGSDERVVRMMTAGGLSAISVAYGNGWDVSGKDGIKLFFDADIERRRGVETVPYELLLTPHLSKDRKTLYGVGLAIHPRCWVEGVHQMRDIGVSIKSDGWPLKMKSEIERLPTIGNSGAEFKAKKFSAYISPASLRSTCLSIAIYNIIKPAYGRTPTVYKNSVHTMFIHPIGIPPKV